jgi:oligosaccharyltransferase complex subunit beta
MLARRYVHLLLQLAFLFIVRVNAKSATGDRVLVIHEEDTIQDTFSQFFASLKGSFPGLGNGVLILVDRGFELSFLNPKKDPGATLTKFEERLYDHIVLFPQKLKGTFPYPSSPHRLCVCYFRWIYIC